MITDLTLDGGSFSRCGAQASARSKRKVRRLWGDGKGSFRTTGRHAAATVRGTRTVQVRAGHSYFARPS